MIMLSIISRGVRGPQKDLFIKMILSILKPYVILIQETMCLGEKAWEVFSPSLRNCSFFSLDEDDMLGGVLTGWSLDFKELSSSSFHSSISVTVKHKDSYYDFSMVNIYGLYYDWVPYWEYLKLVGAFHDLFTMIGRDLNFSLFLRDVWGENPKDDILRGLFLDFFEEMHLVDVEPIKLMPS
jgi:hypothetical protein